jgi:hypothetical protein
MTVDQLVDRFAEIGIGQDQALLYDEQQALDANGLTRLSSDGAVLMRAVADSLGIGPLDLHWADGPRLWRAEDIAALFKNHAPAAGLLARRC